MEENTESVAGPMGLPTGDFNFIMGQPVEDYKWIDVPEWNCKVKIKALTKAEQVKLRRASLVRGQVDDVKMEMNLYVFSMVEPRLTLDQVDELFTKSSAKALNRVTASILTWSGLTDDYFSEAEEHLKS